MDRKIKVEKTKQNKAFFQVPALTNHCCELTDTEGQRKLISQEQPRWKCPHKTLDSK